MTMCRPQTWGLSTRTIRLFLLVAMLVTTSAAPGLLPSSWPADQRDVAAPAPNSVGQPNMASVAARLPLSFEINVGQAHPSARFLSRGPGYVWYLTSQEVVLSAPRPTAPDGSSPGSGKPLTSAKPLRIRLLGSNRDAVVEGADPLPGKVNYLRGKDPAKWRTGVRTFASVRYRGAYPGIDVRFHGASRQVEYDFIVAPGADPTIIGFGIEGADGVEIDDRGDLIVHGPAGDMRQARPTVYQEHDGRRELVAGEYELLRNGEVRIVLGPYDTSRTLVIDPILTYSTYVGGSKHDDVTAIKADDAGNIYIAGSTYSTDFPFFVAADDHVPSGWEAYVVKIAASGTAIEYATYLGSRYGDEKATGLALDGDGSAIVTGWTTSWDFPVTASAFQTACIPYGLTGCTQDAFVTKLDADGSALVFSTRLGGAYSHLSFSGEDQANAVAVDRAGNVYVAGETNSRDFPTRNALDGSLEAYRENRDVFIAKFTAAGSIVYSTYLGHTGNDRAYSIGADDAGHAYVTGFAGTGFPLVNPSYDVFASWNAFATKLNPSGSALEYSTLVSPGPGWESGFNAGWGTGIAVQPSGVAYIASTYPTPGGRAGAKVTKLSPTGEVRYAAAPWAGAALLVSAIAVDAAGNAYVAGATDSPSFPLLNAVDSTLTGYSQGAELPYGQEAFISKINAAGSAFVYSSFLGGSHNEGAYAVALDGQGNAYVAGWTASDDLPLVNPVDAARTGGVSGTNVPLDGFVVRITEEAPRVFLGSPSGAPEGSRWSVGGAFTDASGATAWRAEVDYGDGSGTQPVDLDDKTFLLDHVYPDNGSYPVRVYVFNDRDVVGTATASALITNVAPSLAFSGPPPEVGPGEVFSHAGTFADPGADSFSATVDYGDGDGELPLALAGQTFSLRHVYSAAGSYTVSVRVRDDDGGTGTAWESVTVRTRDTTPPQISGPSVVVAEATGPGGARVTFSPTATDAVDGPVPVTCTPAPGTTFAIGDTLVTCTATDSHGNASSVSFNVKVQDTTPPVVFAPGRITVTASGTAGALVNFTVTATDAVDGVIAPVPCSPESGSRFPVGSNPATNRVTCVATDSRGNARSVSFVVTVNPPLPAPSFGQILPRPDGACLCTPWMVSLIPGGPPQQWWAKMDSDSLRLTVTAATSHTSGPGTVTAKVFDTGGYRVGPDVSVALPPGTPGEVGTTQEIHGLVPGETYRVEVSTPPTSVVLGYSLKFDGARAVASRGQSNLIGPVGEWGPTRYPARWLFSVGADESLAVRLTGPGPGLPGAATRAVVEVLDMTTLSTVELIDPANPTGPFVSTVTLENPAGVHAVVSVAMPAPEPRMYAFTIREANGTHRVLRQDEADRSPYVGWLTSGLGGTSHTVTAPYGFTGLLQATLTSLIETPVDIPTGEREETPFPGCTFVATEYGLYRTVVTMTEGCAGASLTSTLHEMVGPSRIEWAAPAGYSATPQQSEFPITCGTWAEFGVVVTDVVAPEIGPVPDLTVEATGPEGAVVTFGPILATDTGSGVRSVTTDRQSGDTFPLGETVVTISATDNAGNVAIASFTVKVKDTTPPEIIAVIPTPGTLWPPNHKMVGVRFEVTTKDADPAPACRIVEVESDEPIDGLGDGDTAPDWREPSGLTVGLRAERSGRGDGRAYTVRVRCTDWAGHESLVKESTVSVPRDQRR